MVEASFEVRSANCRASTLNLGSKASSCRFAMTALSPIKISLRVCSASQGQQLLHFCISVQIRPCLSNLLDHFSLVFFFSVSLGTLYSTFYLLVSSPLLLTVLEKSNGTAVIGRKTQIVNSSFLGLPKRKKLGWRGMLLPSCLKLKFQAEKLQFFIFIQFLFNNSPFTKTS